MDESDDLSAGDGADALASALSLALSRTAAEEAAWALYDRYCESLGAAILLAVAQLDAEPSAHMNDALGLLGRASEIGDEVIAGRRRDRASFLTPYPEAAQPPDLP